MQILVVRFQTPIVGDERVAVREGSIGKFRALPGLEEKYYLGTLDSPGAGGIYLFDTPAHVQAYLDGPIVQGIQGRYQAPEPPAKQILDVVDAIDLRGSGPVRRQRSVGIVLAGGDAPLSRPSSDEIAAYAARTGLQRLFWVRDDSGREGVLGLWSGVADLDAELAGDDFARLSGIHGDDAERVTFEISRVLSEAP